MHYLFLLLLLTSCSMYRKEFDCCPAEGVPCTPVTTLEKMIVESPCGPDIFLRVEPKLVDIKEQPACACAKKQEPRSPLQRRIWISPNQDGQACYLYFEEDGICDPP
jgi:hypothetical protein